MSFFCQTIFIVPKICACAKHRAPIKASKYVCANKSRENVGEIHVENVGEIYVENVGEIDNRCF